MGFPVMYRRTLPSYRSRQNSTIWLSSASSSRSGWSPRAGYQVAGLPLAVISKGEPGAPGAVLGLRGRQAPADVASPDQAAAAEPRVAA